MLISNPSIYILQIYAGDSVDDNRLLGVVDANTSLPYSVLSTSRSVLVRIVTDGTSSSNKDNSVGFFKAFYTAVVLLVPQ